MKAYIVAKNFMHINVAQRYVTYLVVTVLVFMLLLFAGVAPDVMNDEGTGWVKPQWKADAANWAAAEAAGGEHADEHR